MSTVEFEAMRFLAIDYGEKRLGLALCDEAETFASPHETRDRTGARADIAALLDLVRGMNVEGIVVGLPLSLDQNEIGDSEAAARKWAGKLEAALREAGREIPMFFQDERFSTKEALSGLRAAGISQRAAREGAGGGVDARAAAVLLQAFLDRRREVNRQGEADRTKDEPIHEF